MRLLILEDEAPTAAQIRQFAARYGLPTHDVHEVRSVAKALRWFAEHPLPALIFSDIELLDGNVFSLYEQVPVSCPIIFITAYDQFLQAAFQASGIGYLLKPFTYAQFAASLAKYETLQASFASSPAPVLPVWLAEALTQLRAALQVPAPTYRQRLSVRQPNNGFYLLPVSEVAYLQAEDGLLFAYDRHGARHALTGTLTEWEQQLDPAQFSGSIAARWYSWRLSCRSSRTSTTGSPSDCPAAPPSPAAAHRRRRFAAGWKPEQQPAAR